MFFFQIFGELEEIYYFCGMNEDIRETFHSAEYDEYYAILNKYIQGGQEDDKA